MSGISARSVRAITNSGVKDLVGINENQIELMQDDYQIITLQDLALLEKTEVDSILGSDTSTFLIYKKLRKVAEFIRKGGNLSSLTTMNDAIGLDDPPSATTANTLPSQPSMKRLKIGRITR
eukprot:5676261-Ditylum_brightwellii.AAC.1